VTELQPWGNQSLEVFESSSPRIWVGDGDYLDAVGSYWGVAALELLSVPALPNGETVASVATHHRMLAGQLVRSLRSWENRGGLELRYVWGTRGESSRLRLVLVARAVGADLVSARASASQILSGMTGLFPSGYNFGPLTEPMPQDITAWAEIERAEEERVPGPFVPSDIEYYYLIYPLGGGGTAWPRLPKLLADLQHPGFFSVALIPTRMTEMERQAIDHIGTVMQYLSEPQQGYDYFGNQRTTPGDVGAHDVYLAWQQFPERSGLLARIGVAGAPHEVSRLASLIGPVIAEGAPDQHEKLPTRFKTVTTLNDYDAYVTANFGLVFSRLSHPVWNRPPEQAPITLERMRYFFSEEEAGGLFVLPVPDEHGVPGMALSRPVAARREHVRAADHDSSGVALGRELHYGQEASQVTLPLTAINRHVLVVGQPGSGKTTTVMTLLAELWREHHIPFLVIEPSTRQYRNFLTADGISEDVQVFVLGRDDLSPLRLNPLSPPPGVRQEVHASSVLASLKMSMPLSPPLPQLLEPALRRTYLMAGWEEDTTSADGLQPPTLRDLRDNFDVVFQDIDYQGEALNVGRAGRVRLDSLLSGSRGRMIDTVESTDFAKLLEQPVVIELADIKDPDDLAIVSSFILDQVRAIAEARRSTRGQLRHVTVIEEAHRLLSAGAARVVANDDLNARAGLVRALVDAIAELRSVGEGFVLSSQRPSQLSSDAVANTGTRILHRLDATDRDSILNDFDASDLDRQVAARLGQGEALMRTAEQHEPIAIRIQPANGVDSSEPTADEVVSERMATSREAMKHLLPYRLCTRDVCSSGCDPSVRSAGRKLGLLVGEKAKAAWNESGGSPTALKGIVDLLTRGAHSNQVSYCGAVHLKVEQKAFRIDDGTDIRRVIAQAIEDAR
jgi:DNA helicase HerA-like ATPase